MNKQQCMFSHAYAEAWSFKLIPTRIPNIVCEGGCRELAILHCDNGHPATAEDYHLRTLPNMIERFGLVTGLSEPYARQNQRDHQCRLGYLDHRKHFTLDRRGGGPDDGFSSESAGQLLALGKVQ